MLGGVINVDSFVVKPGAGGVAVCAPQGADPAISVVAMDPAMTVSSISLRLEAWLCAWCHGCRFVGFGLPLNSASAIVN